MEAIIQSIQTFTWKKPSVHIDKKGVGGSIDGNGLMFSQ